LSQAEVQQFLDEARRLLTEDENNLCIVPRRGEDKTVRFMTRYGFSTHSIAAILLTLQLEDYSSTQPDDNENFTGNVWIFGKLLNMPFAGLSAEIYIKLKLENGVLCLSIHEAEYPIVCPYNR